MNKDVFITCAVTGAGDSTAHSPHVPVTPARIAPNHLDAAQAGAAIVHIHVRDPATGKGARNLEYYDEVVERIRASGTDVILNLTCGMGGMLVLEPDEAATSASGWRTISTSNAACSRPTRGLSRRPTTSSATSAPIS